jgi:hypothetical protein
MKFTVCSKCNESISNNNIKKHVSVCNGVVKSHGVKCKYCDKEFDTPSGRGLHEIQCKANPSRRIPQLGRKAWNEGLTKNDSEALARLSALAKQRGLGGHTSKRKLYFEKKSGEVVYLQSSYEIRFAEILEEMDIEWERPSPLIWIDEHGNDHRYYPDFKIGDVYVDTKNDYLAVKDANKIQRVRQQNGIRLQVVVNKDINEDYIARLVNSESRQSCNLE